MSAKQIIDSLAIDVAERDHLGLRVGGDLRGVDRALAASADVCARQPPVRRVGAQAGGEDEEPGERRVRADEFPAGESAL
jgi:hypothetical protein